MRTLFSAKSYHCVRNLADTVALRCELGWVLFCSLAVVDPRVGHTMDVLFPFISNLCHSDWLFRRESCPRLSRPSVVFLVCVHLTLFLALFLSPGNSLVSSWCDHSMLASSLWQCLAVPSLLQFCREPTRLFSLLSTKHAESFSVLSCQRPQDVFLHSFWMSNFHSRTWLQATLALSLVLGWVVGPNFTFVVGWIGLDHSLAGLGRVGSKKMDPWTTLGELYEKWISELVDQPALISVFET